MKHFLVFVFCLAVLPGWGLSLNAQSKQEARLFNQFLKAVYTQRADSPKAFAELEKALQLTPDSKYLKRMLVSQALTDNTPEKAEPYLNFIEQGENANGEYVRFANGLQICMSIISLTGLDIADKQEVWRANLYIPPAAFVGASYVFVVHAEGINNSVSIYLAPSFYSGVMQIWNTGRSPSQVHPGDAVRGTGTNQIYNVTSAIIRVVAIGRWKA